MSGEDSLEEKRLRVKRLRVEALRKEAEEFAAASAPQRGLGAPEPMPSLEDLQAGGVGAVQGALFEHGDELGGAAMALGDVLTGKGPLLNLPSYYDANRDFLRAKIGKLEKGSPGSYLLGNVVGALSPTNKVLGLVGKAGRAKAAGEVEKLTEAAGKALTIPEAAELMRQADKAQGKAQGLSSMSKAARDSAIQGYGASDSDTVAGDLLTAGASGVVGGVIGKATGAIDPKAVRARANEKALKSAGAMTKDFKNLANKGVADDLGRWLNENIITGPLTSLEDVAARAGSKREVAGGVIGNIIDSADGLRGKAKEFLANRVLGEGLADPQQLKAATSAINAAVDREYGFSMNAVADGIEEIMRRDGSIAAARAHFGKLEGLADTFRQIAEGGDASLRNGLRNKTEFRRLMKDVDSLAEEYKQEVYDIISGNLEHSVGKFDQLSQTMKKFAGGGDPIAEVAGDLTRPALPVGDAIDLPTAQTIQDMGQQGQDTAAAFRDANREYARSASAQKMAEERLGQVKSNRDYGLSTMGAAATGFLAGGPLQGAAFGAANNFARQYGSSMQAFAFHKLANVLESSPQAYGKYAPVLRAALARGGSSFLVAHGLLASKDPEFAKFSQQIIEDRVSFNPADIAEQVDLIQGDDAMPSTEKAMRLSSIGTKGYVEMPAVPEPPPPPPAPIAPPAPPITPDRALNAMKAVIGG